MLPTNETMSDPDAPAAKSSPCLHLDAQKAAELGVADLQPGQTYTATMTFSVGDEGGNKALEVSNIANPAPVDPGMEPAPPPQPTDEGVPAMATDDDAEESALGYKPVKKNKPSFPVDMKKLR